MAENTTTLGIEVRVDGAAKAGADLASVDAAVKRVGTSLGSVSKFASTAILDKSVAELKALGVNINTSSRHVQNLAVSMQRVARERAFRTLASDANLSTMQLARLRAELGDTRGAISTLAAGAKRASLIAGAAAAAVIAVGKSCFEASLQADRLSKAYTTITGSAQGAEKQLAFLRETSDRLGLDFYAAAEAAKTFFAAGKGALLEKDLNAIFEGVSSAGAALALTADDMNGIFLALGQMLSKGKVQAEELRGQLGERLPGAFQLAAKAMGMTTAELDKALMKGEVLASDLLPKLGSALKNEFGAAAVDAADGAQGAVNRLSTAWTDLKATIGDSGVIIDTINLVTAALKKLNEYANLRSVSETFAQGVELARQGKLDFDEFSRAGFFERQNMVDGVLRPKNEYSGKISHNPPPDLLLEQSGGSAAKAGASSTMQQAKAAAEAIRQIYVEIERLNGTGGEFGYELSAKLQEIERNGKAAGLSLEEVSALQSGYSQAAIKKHYDDMAAGLRDVDIEIARMSGDYATLNRLEMERDVERQRERLLSLGMAQGEVNAKMEEYAAALEKSQGSGNTVLKERATLLKDIGEMSGNVNMSIQAQNDLLHMQAEAMRASLGPAMEEYINEWERLQKIQSSTAPLDGAKRALSAYYTDAMNGAKNLATFTSNAFSSMEDALVNFASTGKLSFSDMVNGMISDLARLAVRQSITGPLASGLSAGFGGITSWISGLFSAQGNVFSGGNISDYSNSIVTEPTFFGYGTHVSRYARGAGIMGEAGPEAIMPLVRSSGGYLGVRAVDSDSSSKRQDVTVNVYNYGNEKASVKQSGTSDGGKRIDVIIGDVVAKQMNTPGTRLNRAVASQTGASTPVVRR